MTDRHMVAGALRHLAGWRRDEPDPRDWAAPASAIVPTPSVDLRSRAPRVVDQGPIGSCTANAACEALEFLADHQKPAASFSRLFVYYYTRLAEGTAPTDDVGAQLRTTVKVLANLGAAYETSWPDDSPQARFSLQPSDAARAEAAAHKALFYYRCVGLMTVKASLSQGFPVMFGFPVPDNMLSARCAADGLVQPPAANEPWRGAHAVLAVGYDDQLTIGGFRGAVLAQNSWGPTWGIAGFFWLPYWFFTTVDPENPAATLATDCWTIRRAQI